MNITKWVTLYWNFPAALSWSPPLSVEKYSLIRFFFLLWLFHTTRNPETAAVRWHRHQNYIHLTKNTLDSRSGECGRCPLKSLLKTFCMQIICKWMFCGDTVTYLSWILIWNEKNTDPLLEQHADLSLFLTCFRFFFFLWSFAAF